MSRGSDRSGRRDGVRRNARAGPRSEQPQRQEISAWETVEVGPFVITALPAVDGFGDPQVSWCVVAEGRRILHAGDTLFHGWWWLMAMRYGPVDVAFLHCGGAHVEIPSRQPPSPLPAGMRPREAAVAAGLLRARRLVPIHYGPLHHADNYVQADDPAGTVLLEAAKLGVSVTEMRPGEKIWLEPAK